MLKLLVYGYSYGGTGSSRRLERACHHNLSFIWLMADVKPGYRTIGRFRSDNKKALKKVLSQIVKLCIELEMIEGNSLFVDGSKFRADANIANTRDKERREKRLKQINENIERILKEAEEIDKQEAGNGSMVKLETELSTQQEIQEKVKVIMTTLELTKKTSINLRDPDSVKATWRQGRHSSFNAQISVDEKHGLIVSGEVVNENNDLNQLNMQVENATEVLETKPESICSDAGYFSLADIDKISKEIEIIAPSNLDVQRERGNDKQAIKPFGKEVFIYKEAHG